MPHSPTVTFGIKTSPQFTTYDAIARVWQEADATPAFTHAWVFDHFMPLGPDPTGPCLEGWTLLAALAAITTRIRVGVMVTGNTYRHPAVLANMGATVDRIAHGRLDFGIGAGWNEGEHSAYCIPLDPPGARIRRLAEACAVIKALWTQTTASFDGEFYCLRDARCEPKPVQQPYPPFVIGGGGERKTLRVVAEYADIWNFAGGGVAEFQHKSAVLDEHCAAIGRDPATIARSVQVRINPDDLQAARTALSDYLAAGATHLICMLNPPYPDGIVTRLAEEVVGPLTAA